jgi:hypothetical protein
MMYPILYSESLVQQDKTTFALVRLGADKFLRVRGDVTGFHNPAFEQQAAHFFPCSPENATELRKRLEWLRPQPLGLQPSFGFGDRLGLATPGHVRAIRGTGIAPIFAQQSVRENARTGRMPQQVVDDALWGVFQCGWRDAWGADADHLKTAQDIAPFVAAGYTCFTIDPGEFVENAAHTDTRDTLEHKMLTLPWDALQDSPHAFDARYVNQTFAVNGLALTFTREHALRAAVKYGGAVAHTVNLFQEITRQKQGAPFDFEVSVDETETPTSVTEHFYVANELRRLNVRVTSLAPRFVGRFEKGVDYIGDLDTLRVNLDEHAHIARAFHYKLSLHSGSDKFRVYSLFASATRGFGHIKTAGTSYLEALRTIARVDPQLFREILTLARERYPTERATYHVSAHLDRVRTSETLRNDELAQLLDEFDARQILHVTFGSVLHQYGAEIHSTLRANEEEYANTLQTHFVNHLARFKTD